MKLPLKRGGAALIFVIIFLIITAAAAAFIFYPSKFELERPLGFQVLDDGNILVTDGGGLLWEDKNSKVFIINRAGKVLWKYDSGLRFAHSAIKLKNSNILIPDTNNDRLVEVSPAGNTVWTSAQWSGGTGLLSVGSKIDYPNHVIEMGNGHFLLSDRFNSAVVETDRNGQVYRSYKGASKQHAPRELENGNIIIADSDNNRVIEVDKKGGIVWQFSRGLNWPRFARRLENNNTIISDSYGNRIIEVDYAGNTLFEYGKGILSMPYQAEQLPGGNILIADAQHSRLIEINRNKKIVWKYSTMNSLRRWLMMPLKLKNGGAELAGNDKMPKYWRRCDLIAPEGNKWERDTANAAEGRASFKLTSTEGPGKNKWWGQAIKTTGGGKAYFSCKIKTAGVKEGAGVSLNFVDRKGGILGGVNSKTFSADTEWTGIDIITPVPKGTVIVGISLSLIGEGTAWWDDVKYGKSLK
ncbi:MAG TPA: hypothetical protein PKZ78_04895 [Candidatus Goldiibacteriota bacterium]|nr:hypothetical protein [Candidatus Goldiibacteriota bacterium]